MESAILLAAAAGAIVVLTPGPAVLALLGIGAAQGRRAGAGFLIGHLVGDTLWAVLALIAMIGAKVIAPVVFQVLALVCGAYLFHLGLRAVRVRRDATGQTTTLVRRPLHRGLMFGVTNPKSYPVTLSVFTALLAGDLAALTPTNAPLLLVSVFAGFLVADVILIWLVGTPALRRLYRAGELWIVRATGVMFIGFAVTTIVQALPTFGSGG
jgi:threonine/homoserine/homoserine lactone efflux protein